MELIIIFIALGVVGWLVGLVKDAAGSVFDLFIALVKKLFGVLLVLIKNLAGIAVLALVADLIWTYRSNIAGFFTLLTDNIFSIGKLIVLLFLLLCSVCMICGLYAAYQSFLSKKRKHSLEQWLEENASRLGETSVEDVPLPAEYKKYEYPDNETWRDIVSAFLVSLWEKQKLSLVQWLEENGLFLGETSVENFPLPEDYKKYKYPDDKTWQDIVSAFLNAAEITLCGFLMKEIPQIIMSDGGMMDDELIIEEVNKKFAKCTHTTQIVTLFDQTVQQLLNQNVLERPINYPALRCVGVELKSGLDSEDASGNAELKFDSLAENDSGDAELDFNSL